MAFEKKIACQTKIPSSGPEGVLHTQCMALRKEKSSHSLGRCNEYHQFLKNNLRIWSELASEPGGCLASILE